MTPKLLRTVPALLLASCASAPSNGQSPSLEDVFDRVHSSVVTIHTSSRGVDVDPGGRSGLTSVTGLGSGVLIGADGAVLTAAHVVQTADVVVVEFTDGALRRAAVVASDPLNDVALVRVIDDIPAGTHVASLGDSDRVRVGRRVFVVGAPHGIGHTLTVGHISARRRPDRKVRTMFETELLQTDAAINEGNSGGPMFDLDGEVIGIVSHIVSESGGSEGLGFAVTSNVARRELLETPAFWSGIEIVFVTGELARILNLPKGQSGLLVQRVARRSPSERLGLHAGTHVASIDGETFVAGGDIILEVEGIEVGAEGALEDILSAIRALRAGDRIDVTVLRDGELVGLSAEIEG